MPRSAHRSMARLVDGGRLQVETPNIGSSCHKQFLENWRGLEPPRHLVMFDLFSLKNLMRSERFCGIENVAMPSAVDFIYTQSTSISEGVDPYSNQRKNISYWGILKHKFIQCFISSENEFITLVGYKFEGSPCDQ